MAELPGTTVENLPDQQVYVPGIGDLHFPGHMSREEMEKAIKEHPKYNSMSNSLARKDRLQEALPTMLQGIYGHLRDPGWTTHVAKGIPVAGAYAEDTPASTDLAKYNPKTAAGLEIAGNVGSMVAPAGAVSKGLSNYTKFAPGFTGIIEKSMEGLKNSRHWGDLGWASRALPRSGPVQSGVAPGVAAESVAQGGLGVGVGTADKLARTGELPSTKDSAIDFAGGAMGPAIGKFISPLPNANRYTLEAKAALPADELHHLLNPAAREAAKQAAKGTVGRGITDLVQNPTATGLLGLASSLVTGQHPVLSALGGLGITGGHYLNVARNHNTLMHDPFRQAVLNALGHSEIAKSKTSESADSVMNYLNQFSR